MNEQQRDFIEFALQQQALRFGDFCLKSGRQSPYFFNAGVFASGHSLSVSAQHYAHAIQAKGIDFDVLFGPAYKGIPLATATVMALQQHYQRDVPFAFNRKEIKDHGEGGQLVGSDIRGKNILLIDDVLTAGSAVREVTPLLAQQDAHLVGAIIALNRQERGQGQTSTVTELQETFNIQIHSIITLQDLLEYLQHNKAYAQHLPAMEAYWEQDGSCE